jgi:hypothetical protein
MLRIVDESGDDYLCPKAFFRAIALPQSVGRAVLAAEQARHCERQRSNPGPELNPVASSLCFSQ